MTYGPADVDETVRGVRVRMLAVPAWTCTACGQRQVSISVARYMSEYLSRLLTNLPPTPTDLDHPLIATEVVFAAR
jgi:hypothetical protein